jgi:hypothetical protein
MFAAILPPFLGHLLIGGYKNVATWPGSQITDDAM